MNKNNTSNFKIRLDDEETSSQFREEIENIRIQKLNNRITFITVLIPCIIGIIIFIAYADIKKRVTTVHNTEITEVKNLSKDLEIRISALNSLYNEIKNHVPSLQAKLNEAKTAIKHIKSVRQTDDKRFKSSIATIEKNFSTISHELKTVSSELTITATKFTNEIGGLSKTMDKAFMELNKLKSDILKLSSIKIDKRLLDSTLKNEQKFYDQKLHQIKSNIEKKILSIKTLLKINPSEDTINQSTTIEPEAIIEQNIQ